MNFKYFVLSVITMVSSMAFADSNDKDKEQKKAPLCKTVEECNDPNNPCTCYCSRQCGPRNKTADDTAPIWVEKDPAKKKCYCQHFDYCKFDERCSSQEHVAHQKID